MSIKKPERARQSSMILKPGGAVILFYIAILIGILNLTGIFFQRIMGYDNSFTKGLEYLADTSEEYNIPALFSTLLLFIASVLLFIVYYLPDQKNPKHSKFWLLLSFIFLFLSIDEATVIHERFSFSKRFEDEWKWIIPYGVFVLAGGLFFLRFLMKLAPKTRKLFIIAGFIYVGAAVGFESAENHIMLVNGPTYQYFLLCALEEFLEMTGTIIFIYALLGYIAPFNFSLKITSGSEKAQRQEQFNMNGKKEVATHHT